MYLSWYYEGVVKKTEWRATAERKRADYGYWISQRSGGNRNCQSQER
jgi:hypothetical protein